MATCLKGERENEEGEREESRPLLIEDSEQLAAEKRSRRKRACVLLSTLGLGLGLCLGIALPLTLGVSSGSGGGSPVVGTDTGNVASPFLQLMVQNQEGLKSVDAVNKYVFGHDQGATTVVDDSEMMTDTSQTDHPHHTHDRPHRHHTLVPRRRSTTPVTPTDHNMTATPLPRGACRLPPESRRDIVDINRIDGRLLFEVARIQSDDTPGSVYDVSCAVERFNLTVAGENDTKEGSAGLGVRGYVRARWQEGSHRHRVRRNAVAELRAGDTAKDWTMNITEPDHLTGIAGHLSILAQLDGYLLTYTCYPFGQQDFESGYVISVLVNVWAGISGVNYQLVDVLLGIANRWGLNPDEYGHVYITHRHCI